MYANFFKFSEKPFELTPDPKFLFLSPTIREVLATILYGVRERRGFLVLVGEPGTGKTTLLNSCIDRMDASVKVAFLFNMGLSFEELLHMALVDLELASIDEKMTKPKAIQRLNYFAISHYEKGGNVVIILDEAQNIDPHSLESLRQLSNLETRKHKLIQIVLSGQPELENLLSRPKLRQLAQRIALRCRTTRLGEKEAYEYIQHRLHMANYRGQAIFSNKAKQVIWEYAKGIPRLINVLCDGSLLIAYGLERKRIDSAIVREVIKDLHEVPLEQSNVEETNSVETFLDSINDKADEYDENLEETFTESYEEQIVIDESVSEVQLTSVEEISNEPSDDSQKDYRNSLDTLAASLEQSSEKRVSRIRPFISAALIVVMLSIVVMYFFKDDGSRFISDIVEDVFKNKQDSVSKESTRGPVKAFSIPNTDIKLNKRNLGVTENPDTTKGTETRPLTRTIVRPVRPETNTDNSIKKSNPDVLIPEDDLQEKTRKSMEGSKNIKNDIDPKASTSEKISHKANPAIASLPGVDDSDTESNAMEERLHSSSPAQENAEKKTTAVKNDEILVKRGESLIDIIIKTYGKYTDQILSAVLSQNPEIKDPNIIFENQVIRLPRDIESN